MKGSAHESFPVLCDWPISELFTKNNEMLNPPIIYYAQTILVLSRDVVLKTEVWERRSHTE